MKTPIALSIAGSDSGGGAGIQADIKAMSANGVYSATVITALTAQNTLGVTAVHDVPVDFISAQLDAVFSDLDIGATKIGMLSQTAVIETVSSHLKSRGAKNIVLDPVMVATSGDLLIERAAIKTLVRDLLPLADLITPNLYEAAAILGLEPADSREEMEHQAQLLISLGTDSVLIKGGHFESGTADDLLMTVDHERWYSAPRIPTPNTHGTGCTLSSAIAANLAKGQALEDAVAAAKDYVSGAIAGADSMRVGQGAGPIDHFWQFNEK